MRKIIFFSGTNFLKLVFKLRNFSPTQIRSYYFSGVFWGWGGFGRATLTRGVFFYLIIIIIIIIVDREIFPSGKGCTQNLFLRKFSNWESRIKNLVAEKIFLYQSPNPKCGETVTRSEIDKLREDDKCCNRKCN